MCEFCDPVEYRDGKEIMNQLALEPINMGEYSDVLQLETWLMSDDKGENPKLHICLAVSYGGCEIQTISVPIKYCPKCGRKLVE